MGGGILLCEGCTDNLSENLNVRKGVTLTAIGSSDSDLAPEGADDARTKGYWTERDGQNGEFYWNDPSETLSASVYGSEDWSTINVDESSKIVEVTATRGATIGDVTGNNRQAALTCTVAKNSVSVDDYIYYTNGAVSAENPSSVTFSMPDTFTQNNGTNSAGVAPMFIYGSGKINSVSESGISAGGIVFQQVCATFCMDLKNTTASDIALGKVKISVQTPTGSNDLAVFPKEYSMTVDPSTDTFTLNENEAAGRYSEVETSLNNKTVEAGATYYTYFLTLPTTITDAVFVVKAYIDGQYKTLKKVRVKNLTTQSGYIYHLPVEITDTNIAASDDDYYKDFMSDKGIEIGGHIYKASDFDSKYIYLLDSEENSTLSVSGNAICFVSEGVEATVTTDSNRAQCIIIGRSKTSRSKFTLKTNALRFWCKQNNTNSHFVLFNLDFDATQLSQNSIQGMVSSGDGTGGDIERLAIENCIVRLNPSTVFLSANSGPSYTGSTTTSKAYRSINHISIKNNKFIVPATVVNKANLIYATYDSDYDDIEFSNNIVYAPHPVDYRMFNFVGTETSTELGAVTFRGNTFINLAPGGNRFILTAKSLTSLVNEHNIYLSQGNLSGYTYLVRLVDGNPAADKMTVSDNYSFMPNQSDLGISSKVYVYKVSFNDVNSSIENKYIYGLSNFPFASGWDIASGYFPINRSKYPTAGSTIDD